MSDDTRNIQINIQKIPVGSSIGAAVLIVLLLSGMFMDLPGVRGPVLGGIGVGLIFGFALIRWRRRSSDTSSPR